MSTDDENIERSRRNAIALSGVMVGGLGLVGWAASYDGDNQENFSESVDDPVEQTAKELNSRNYENFHTDLDNINIDQIQAGEAVYLTVGLDSFEDDPENVRELLQGGTYLSEGADIFSTFAGNLLESDQVEELGLTYDSGILENKVTYRFDADEVREATEGEKSLEEYYRDIVSSF